MKFGKKLLAAAIAGATALSLAACGSSSNSNALSIAWWGNQDRNDRMSKIDAMFEEQNDGVSIDGQFSEYYDYWQKLSTNAAGNSLPDIIQMDYQYLKQYEDNGLLVDLKQYIDDGTIDLSKVDESTLEPGQVGDKTYALTNAVNAPVLVYNKTLLDDAGITVPDNMTLEQFESVSKQVYEKTGVKTNFYYYESANVFEYVMRGEGIQLFEDDGLGAKSSKDLEPYFEVYEKGIKEGWHLDPSVFTEITVGSNDQNPLVYGSEPSHRSWCAFAFTNNLSTLQSKMTDGEELGITVWPSSNVKKSNYVKPSQFWAISKNCKNPELAAKWLNFYVNNVEANKILLTDRGLPISKTIQEKISSDLSESDQAAMKFLNETIVPNSSKIMSPWTDAASTVSNKTLPTIEENLCYQKISAKEAAQQFFDQANETMSK